MIYALTVITIFQSIIKISRKKSSYIILLIMMLVISMGNYFNADYLVYERMYNNAEYSRLEPVFSLLMALGRTIGLSYHQFAVMVILIGFIIILSSIKNKNITNYVLLAYLFYPFLLDVTQIRFF
nr:EpsG family protein [Soehngenia longivitae]